MNRNSKTSGEPWSDPDDEDVVWTAQMFRDAASYRDGVLLRPASGTVAKPGRPLKENPKKQISLRLDPDVVERFRATGKGWQSRINIALREALGI